MTLEKVLNEARPVRASDLGRILSQVELDYLQKLADMRFLSVSYLQDEKKAGQLIRFNIKGGFSADDILKGSRGWGCLARYYPNNAEQIGSGEKHRRDNSYNRPSPAHGTARTRSMAEPSKRKSSGFLTKSVLAGAACAALFCVFRNPIEHNNPSASYEAMPTAALVDAEYTDTNLGETNSIEEVVQDTEKSLEPSYSELGTLENSLDQTYEETVFTSKAAEYEQLLKTSPELRAAIELISSVESNGRFNLIYGGIYLEDYSSHPYYVNCAGGYCSDAAGLGQFLSGTWNSVSSALGLKSFTPKEQLVGMVYLLDQKRGVLDEILEGNIEAALPLMSCEWAGLPSDHCKYGQLDNYLWRRAVEAEVTSSLAEQGITSDSFPDSFQSRLQTEIDNLAYSMSQEDIDSIISRERNEYLEEKISLYKNKFLPAAKAGEDIVSQTLGP